MVLVRQNDQPGIIAGVSRILGEADVNISFMSVRSIAGKGDVQGTRRRQKCIVIYLRSRALRAAWHGFEFASSTPRACRSKPDALK